jgi:LPPG:FO 2-phospho-L-lactate transferase
MSATAESFPPEYNVVCLAGGVGGAKLAAGLAELLPPEQLTVIVNTGDDFQHLGLTICPDLDTVMYTLGGVANPETGWGRAGETWRTIHEVIARGGPDWFNLGDLDLATHLLRTSRLQQGESLTSVTCGLCAAFGIATPILPMSDQPAPTIIQTDDGPLPFQVWFVRERWQPVARAIMLPADVRASGAVAHALEAADIVILAPSNPFVSIDPILNVYPIREMVNDLPRAVVAVSPIVGGTAVKGPAAKMMAEMDMPVTAAGVAAYYDDLLDGFVYDAPAAGAIENLACASLATDTLMRGAEDRRRLAAQVLGFALELSQ